jgi:hypothetical protein
MRRTIIYNLTKTPTHSLNVRRVMRTQTDYRGGEEEEERMFPIHGYVGPTFEER